MDWKWILVIVAIFILAGQLHGQSNSDELTCDELLFRDLFKSIHLKNEQRRDDVLYLRVVKKQFDHQIQIISFNGYSDNESLLSTFYENRADISCLAIGEAFEVMVVFLLEVKKDSLFNLPESKVERENLLDQFSERLNISTELDRVYFALFEPISCGPGPNPPKDIGSMKTPAQIISEELEKLSRPLKLKKI